MKKRFLALLLGAAMVFSSPLSVPADEVTSAAAEAPEGSASSGSQDAGDAAGSSEADGTASVSAERSEGSASSGSQGAGDAAGSDKADGSAAVSAEATKESASEVTPAAESAASSADAADPDEAGAESGSEEVPDGPVTAGPLEEADTAASDEEETDLAGLGEDDTTYRSELRGSDKNANNYGWNWASVDTSYLIADGSGYMRFQYGSSLDKYYAEYYDAAFKFRKQIAINKELPYFGAFYAQGSYYYLITGQANKDQSDSVECYRVTKYDRSWNRLSSVGLYACNTYYPFDAGSCRVTGTGNWLAVHTCHTMYATSDGYHHQANVTFLVNTDTMQITDSYTGIMNINVGYVSHSFNQFIGMDSGNKLVTIDHGDAYPRSIVLVTYTDDVTTGGYGHDYWNGPSNTTVLSIPGATGNNYTGVTVGGFEITGSTYLVAFSSVDLNNFDSSDTKNVYISSVSKSTRKVTTRQVTSYAEGTGKAGNPHLVSTGDGNYLLLWTRSANSTFSNSSDTTTYYQKIDASGKALSQIRSMEAPLSDVQPVINNGKVSWYVWDNDSLVFYSIDAGSLSSSQVKVPVQPYSVSLDKTSLTMTYKGTQTLTATVAPSNADDKTVSWSSSDAKVVSVDQNGKLTANSVGTATVKVRTNDSGRTASCKVTVNALNLADGSASVAPIADQVYTGSAIRPAVTVSSGGITLVSGTDYTVSYSSNKNAGTAAVTVTGRGNCTGSLAGSFRITAKSISNAAISGVKNKTYTGAAQTQNITVKDGTNPLAAGTDYTVSYKNNTNAGTATLTVTGKGNYSGTKNATFKISAKSIAGADVSGIQDAFYYGKAVTQTVTVKAGTKTLAAGTDYRLSYKNNDSVGTATVIISGNGNYTGTVRKTFEISIERRPVYRVYNPNSGEHHFTLSKEEQDMLVSLGWKNEAIAWVSPGWSKTPVYRLYNPNAGEHHYTTNEAERDNLVHVGWRYEGIGWYSDDAQTIAIYRVYNPNAYANNHHYTRDKSERDHLISLGWRDEDIGWYSLA